MREGGSKLDDLLEDVGVGCFIVRLGIACGLGWLADTAWITAVIAITVPVQYEFGVPETAAGALLPILFGAQGIGALIFGPVSDRFGRLVVFTVTLLLAGVAGCIAASLSTFWALVLLIGVAGVGVGGNMPVDGSIAIELCPRSARGRLMSLLTIFWSVGSILAYVIAWAVVPTNSCDAPPAPCDLESNRGWRYVLFAISGFCLASLLPRLGLPESPVWLHACGRTEEAVDVLRRIARYNGRVLPANIMLDQPRRVTGHRDSGSHSMTVRNEASGLLVNAPNLSSSSLAPLPAEEPRATSRWAWLGDPWMQLTMVLLVILWFLSNFGYGLFNSMTLILITAKLGVSPTGSDAYRNAIITSCGGPIGAILGALLVDTRLGRKWTLVLGSALMAASLGVFYAVSSGVAVVASGLFTQATAQIMYAALYLYSPEIFPTDVRASGVALLSFVSRVAGIVAPIMGHALHSAGVSADGIVAIAIASTSVLALCAAALPFETRGCDLA